MTQDKTIIAYVPLVIPDKVVSAEEQERVVNETMQILAQDDMRENELAAALLLQMLAAETTTDRYLLIERLGDEWLDAWNAMVPAMNDIMAWAREMGLIQPMPNA